MKIKHSIILASLLSFGAVNAAHAETKLRGEVFCFPAKDVPKLVEKLGEVDASRRDIVDVALEPKFLIKDGGDWPERFFIRTAASEIDVPIEKPSGDTPSFFEVAMDNSDGDICVADKARASMKVYISRWAYPRFSIIGQAVMTYQSLKRERKTGRVFIKK